jgi:hypothetical protein
MVANGALSHLNVASTATMAVSAHDLPQEATVSGSRAGSVPYRLLLAGRSMLGDDGEGRRCGHGDNLMGKLRESAIQRIRLPQIDMS